MRRYESTRGYLTTVEKSAIVREGRGDEPRSSTQVALKLRQYKWYSEAVNPFI